MSRPQRISAAATLAVCALLGTVGCSSTVPTPPPSATPTPSIAPAFESEEQALAAATAAYTEYLAVSDAILADGGENPERIAGLVTRAHLVDELDGFEYFARNGLAAVGRTQLVQIRLQRFDKDGDSPRVVAYACVDGSAIDIVSADGVAIDKVGGGLRAFEVEFDLAAGSLLLDRLEPWDSVDDC